MKEEEINKSGIKEQQMMDLLRESIEINKEMAKSLKFIKAYFHRRTLFNLAKVIILVGVVVFGAISFQTAVNYFEGYNKDIKTYSNQLNQLSNFTKLLELKKQ